MSIMEETIVWNNAFKIIEIAFKGDDIKINLNEVLKEIQDFTGAEDIHIYKYDNSINELFNFISLIDNNKKITDFYKSEQIIDRVDEFRISTNENCYIIIIDYCKTESFLLNKEHYSILERAFQIIFEKLDLYEKTKKDSIIDALTGVWNRRHYFEFTNELYKDGEVKITFALIDLFNLKSINDYYGYNYGDQYIIKASQLLKEVLNDDEMLFRFGGDEFIIISQNTTSEEMQEKLIMVNKKLNDETFNLKIPFPLLINYGVVEGLTTLDDSSSKAHEIMERQKTETYQNLRMERRGQKFLRKF